jgi:pimeloyl-ACP methyl ester carboxylesterase
MDDGTTTMTRNGREYGDGMAVITARLVAFLRLFEQLQHDIDFRQPQAAQQQLRAVSEELLSDVPVLLATLMPPNTLQTAHRQLGMAIEVWTRAVARLLAGSGPDFGLAFVESRRLWCEGLALAYGVRGAFPALQSYWLSDEAQSRLAAIDMPAADNSAATGVQQEAASSAHGAYACYVPESYTPSRAWPVIVCLHGAYGHGHEYLWTWLRVARSQGCIVLAPKSRGPTWSLLEPEIDIASVRAMLASLGERYHLDMQRIFLSGLSDGGSFAYVLGLSCPSLIAGVAPIAGVLHPVADRLLRAGQGLEVPLFVVHGARDFIFDVHAVRSHCALLAKLGYRITYTELPTWGHAYTDAINEHLVWPWFAALPGAACSAA